MKQKRRRWTPAEDQVIRERFPTMVTRDVAKLLGRTECSTAQRAYSLGVKKTAAHLSSQVGGRLQKNDPRGGATRFKPGHQAWNKGTHYKAGGRSHEFRFKPGVRPHTWRPIGTVVIDADGYTKRKVRDDAPKGMGRKNWVFVHRELWEQHNGPIPAGFNVTFINGNKTDIRIENLELVSRAVWMKRHTVHNLPKELAQLVQLKGAVVRQINKRMRQHGE